MTRALPLALLAAASSALGDAPPYVQNSAYGVKTAAYAKNAKFDFGGQKLDSDEKGGAGSESASTGATVPSANSTAYGSLGTGAMHLGAFADAPDGEEYLMSEAQAMVEIWDTVTVYWGHTSVSRIPLTVRFDGSRSGPEAHSGFEYFGVTASAEYTADQDLWEIDDVILPPLTNDPIRTTTFKVYARAFVSAYSNNSPYQEGYGFEGEASASDYTHTLKFMWNLPAGVTYTSESGHFNPQAVPEPGSMVVLGVGAIGLLRRRAKRRA